MSERTKERDEEKILVARDESIFSGEGEGMGSRREYLKYNIRFFIESKTIFFIYPFIFI